VNVIPSIEHAQVVEKVNAEETSTTDVQCAIEPPSATVVIKWLAQADLSNVVSSQWTDVTYRPFDEWRVHAIRRIAELANLQGGWDGSDAEAPNRNATDSAKKVLEVLEKYELEPSRIDPSVEDGITISFFRGDLYADIECFNSGMVLAVYSDRRSKPIVWNVTSDEEDVSAAVNRIRKFLKN
jgi:hypothetical protein